MQKNYFFLNRFIIEINEALNDCILNSIFSQEKNILIIEFIKNNHSYFIEISVNPGLPFITLRENCHRAKKNTIDFFEVIAGAQFQSISIADSDRILRISTNKGCIYFFIRGKFTNVCSTDKKDNLQFFKNPNEESKNDILLDELKTVNFITNFNIPNLSPGSEFNLNTFLKKFPFIGKEIVYEAKYRCGNEEINDIISIISEIINEINNGELAVFIDETNYLLHLGVNTFHIFPYTSVILFKDMSSAVNYFISKKYYFEQLSYKKKRIGKHLDKELSRITSKLNSLKASIDKGSKEKEFNKLGNLLLINLSLIRHGMKSIEVIDIYNDNLPITIKLDETISPKKNVDYYFDKARSGKVKIEKIKISPISF